MKLAIFDFDGTLFNSPTPDQTRIGVTLYGELTNPVSAGGYGWYEDSITLSPQVTTELGNSFKSHVLTDAIRACTEPDTIAILMTGRNETFRNRVTELCDSVGLEFDEYLLKPVNYSGSTLDFKMKEIKRMIPEYDIDSIELWDDRKKHIKKFRDYLPKLLGEDNVIINHIDEDDVKLPPVVEDLVIEYLQSKYPKPVKEKKYGGPLYYALVLEQDSQSLLMGIIDIPDGWLEFAHHMTVIHKSHYSKHPEIVDYISTKVGDVVDIEVDSLGMSELAIAVRVTTVVPSINQNKHITIATAPHAKAKDSNLITNWVKLDSKIMLKGVISAVD